MGNAKNLKVLSHEEARELGRKGGLKSAEVRRQKKNMAEALSLLLDLEVKDKKIVKKLKSMGIKKEDVNNQMVMLISIFQKAFKGDVRAAEFIRDTSGQNPNKPEMENSAPVNIAFLPDYGKDDDEDNGD